MEKAGVGEFASGVVKMWISLGMYLISLARKGSGRDVSMIPSSFQFTFQKKFSSADTSLPR